ncbi:MAG: YIP1 family protein [Proteobacteria bacterium]|nr:YIP1 family protein [Pseudomonadota bacterium]
MRIYAMEMMPGPLSPGAFVRTAVAVAFSPSRAFSPDQGAGRIMRPLSFLLACSAIGAALTGVFATEGALYASALALANGLAGALVLGGLLHVAGRPLAPGRLSGRVAFTVASYASLPVALAWIPGFAAWAGLWRLYLLGAGAAAAAGLSRGRAFLLMALVVGLWLVAYAIASWLMAL